MKKTAAAKKKATKKTPTKSAKGQKITFAVYMQSNGDGSASPRFFPDEDAAERFAQKDDERFCDDIMSCTIMVDAKGIT